MQMDEPVIRIMEGSRDDGAVVLTVQGEVDMATVDELRVRLADACERSGAVTVDLRRVAFLDCLGLRLLLEVHEQTARAGCRLDFVRGPAAVQRLFELTGTLDRLSFVDARHAPVAAAAGG